MVTVVRPKNTNIVSEREEKTANVLKKMREVSIEDEAALAAAKHGFLYIDLLLFPVETNDVLSLPEEDAKRLGAAIFQKEIGIIRIALTDPNNAEALSFFTDFAEKHRAELRVYIVSTASLEKVWQEYSRKPFLENLDHYRISLQGKDLEEFEADFGGLLDLKNDASKIPTSRIIEIILAGANKLHASDIHIEPDEDSARLRYRIDGLLQEIGNLPLEIYRLALSRIKMLSKMKLNIRDRSQDGHFFIMIKEDRVDIRVSLIPGNHGENINMRLLSGKEAFVSVSELGLRDAFYEEIQNAIEKPHGMIVNTGPTGSGKTTTLYSLLNSLNNPSQKIITVEDPIEYALPGIIQTEVSKDNDYTFGKALRAIVRQDPDIILVGEIRDEETAEIAINAALTGHLVFTTLHTNDAPASIVRLAELGIKPSLISSAVNIFIAQRLVRVLCEECRESYAPAETTIAALKKLLSYIPKKSGVVVPSTIDILYKPKGCGKCNFTGYRGRKGIFEIFRVTEAMGETISSLASEGEIRKAAVKEGMVTMIQDGILKVIEGITTLDEVWRNAGKEESLEELYAEILSDPNIQKPKEEE
ncbi:MAG: GspE/PulE family protein [Patescibacteria group bacterium]